MTLISENLTLPYIAPAQAQKHVTHNESIRALDAVVQLSLMSKSDISPPVTPNAGERYFVPNGATGDWTGHDGNIAAYQDGGWIYYSPQIGWQAYIIDAAALHIWDGLDWQEIGGPPDFQNLDHIGIHASADAANRLAISSPASLFNHEGAGHQVKINKNTASDTAALLFQTGYSGRAEMGLIANDDFQFKTSIDGSQFNQALHVQASSGIVTKPSHPYIYGTLGNMVAAPARQSMVPDPQSSAALLSNNGTRLTAPITGVYMFTASQLAAVSSGTTNWNLYHNANVKYKASQYSGTLNSHIFYMGLFSAGDTLELACDNVPSTSFSGNQSHFSFTLIG